MLIRIETKAGLVWGLTAWTDEQTRVYVFDHDNTDVGEDPVYEVANDIAIPPSPEEARIEAAVREYVNQVGPTSRQIEGLPDWVFRTLADSPLSELVTGATRDHREG
jgi:hypothetical protein